MQNEMSCDGAPETAANSVRQALLAGILLFDQRRFFESHEQFEHVWQACDGDDQDQPFWKGVTQVAVGCCHAQRGNRHGSLALLERSVGYLQRFPSPHRGIDTKALIGISQSVASLVRQHGPSADLEFPRFPHSNSDLEG
jgi:predicted metal-dependent hydrolase